MGLMLLAITASLAFAQRVGETVQLSGQTYRVESNSGGRVVLQLVPSLNGVWVRDNGEQITINGNTGVYNSFGSPNAVTQDAINKGYVKIGDQRLRNFRSTGNLTWTVQTFGYTFNRNNPNVATGTEWRDFAIIMSADGQTITLDNTLIYTRR